MAIRPDSLATIGARLAEAERMLAEAGLPSAREDALALLGSVLGVSSAVLLSSSNRAMRAMAAERYSGWIGRRAAGEAVPHITGHLVFMDLDLAVTRATPLLPVYAPRLVERALESARRGGAYDLRAAEVGTGCGAVTLALAAFEPRFARIYAVDQSPETLRVAIANGRRYLLNLVITWVEGEGLETVPEPGDLVVQARASVATSPEFADLVAHVSTALLPGGTLICGLDQGQGDEATRLVSGALPAADIWVDAQSDGEVLSAQLPRSTEVDAAFVPGR